MEYRRLGNSGLRVSEIGLGGNNFGGRADKETSIDIVNHALEMGILAAKSIIEKKQYNIEIV